MPSIFPSNNSEGHVCEKSVTHSERAVFLRHYKDYIGCFILISIDIVWKEERLQPYAQSRIYLWQFLYDHIFLYVVYKLLHSILLSS